MPSAGYKQHLFLFRNNGEKDFYTSLGMHKYIKSIYNITTNITSSGHVSILLIITNQATSQLFPVADNIHKETKDMLQLRCSSDRHPLIRNFNNFNKSLRKGPLKLIILIFNRTLSKTLKNVLCQPVFLLCC